MEKKELPALVDLYNDAWVVLNDNRNQLNVLLNQSPKPEWIKTHPLINGHKYIPIERIEYILTRIFIKWKPEILETKLIANSVTVTLRLHYLDPVTGEWEWTDGVGASPLQTDKGAGAVDFNQMKNAAVMMALPAAKTFALKDAAENLGKLFGKDLNRKDEIAYDNLTNTFTPRVTAQSLKRECEELLKEVQDDEFRQEIIDEVMEAQGAKADNEVFYSRMLEKLSHGKI